MSSTSSASTNFAATSRGFCFSLFARPIAQFDW